MVMEGVGTRNRLFLHRRSAIRAKVSLRHFAVGRKCRDIFTNTCRNSMKLRNLGCQFFGRKYVKNFRYGIAVSEKMTIFATQ